MDDGALAVDWKIGLRHFLHALHFCYGSLLSPAERLNLGNSCAWGSRLWSIYFVGINDPFVPRTWAPKVDWLIQ